MEKTDIKVGFITVSDRVTQGVYEDIGGPAMVSWVENAILSPWQKECIVVADEQDKIQKAIIDLVDNKGCHLVLTTGGTGPAKRDVTPEATQVVCDRILDGFAQQMRAISLQTVPTAILSRQIAGTRKQCLIINLPGKPEAIGVCLSAVFLAVPKCLELLDDINLQINLDFIEGVSL